MDTFDHCFFRPGSYWIYTDSFGNQDTCTIDTFYRNTIESKNYYPYEQVQLLTDWSNPHSSYYDQYSLSAYHYGPQEGTFTFQMSSSHNLISEPVFTSFKGEVIQELKFNTAYDSIVRFPNLDSLEIQGKMYYDVAKIRFVLGDFIRTSYWVKHVGQIRFQDSQGGVHELVDHEVFQ